MNYFQHDKELMECMRKRLGFPTVEFVTSNDSILLYQNMNNKWKDKEWGQMGDICIPAISFNFSKEDIKELSTRHSDKSIYIDGITSTKGPPHVFKEDKYIQFPIRGTFDEYVHSLEKKSLWNTVVKMRKSIEAVPHTNEDFSHLVTDYIDFWKESDGAGYGEVRRIFTEAILERKLKDLVVYCFYKGKDLVGVNVGMDYKELFYTGYTDMYAFWNRGVSGLGIYMALHAIEMCHSRGIDVYDIGMCTNDYKFQFMPKDTPFGKSYGFANVSAVGLSEAVPPFLTNGRLFTTQESAL